MLDIKVLNVGDGDAILLRQFEDDGSVFTALIDTGRPFLETSNDSNRREIMMHLEREGVIQIDVIILTHLHIDHVGGTMSVLHHIPVRSIVSLYVPPVNHMWVKTPDSTEKSVLGLCQMLNFYSDIVSLASIKGTPLEKIEKTIFYQNNGLDISFILPDRGLLTEQAELFDALYYGKSFPDDVMYRASKARNELSLMIDVRYAGKRALLCGDRYGYTFENSDIGKADILKLPHHGDKKSVTLELMKKISPKYAVISCENVYNVKKRRPDPDVIHILTQYTDQFHCTENCSFPGLEASSHTLVGYQIYKDGSMNCYLE